MNDDWPELVGGWELARHGHIENYRKRLANNVTVTAIWENKPGTGSVDVRVEPLGLGRTLTRSRKNFRDKEAFDLSMRIDQLDKHVWAEQREYDQEEDQEEEVDESKIDDDADGIEVPDVTGVRSGPDTGHDVVTVLEGQFGITEDYLMAHVDWSALIVVGEPAVSSLINQVDELHAALQPRWYPVVVDRPGEQWVVLRRTGM